MTVVARTSRRRRLGTAVAALLAVSLTATACGADDADQAVSNEALNDEAVSNEAVSDEALNDEALSNEALNDEAVSDEAPSTAPEPEPTADNSDSEAETADGAAPGPYVGELVPEVVATYPHDPTAFTQGLEWYGDRLLESTGLLEESSLRLVDPQTGEAEVLVDVADELFAEGVTVVDGKALQLTWQNETLLVSDLERLGSDEAVTRTDQAYDGEGWGLCYDGSALVMSDGSSQLTFRDPTTFEETGRVEVTLDGSPVSQLNELECVGSQVWANVWRTDRILAIDADSGVVEATVDASSLVPDGVVDGDDVLNGIAHDEATGRFWLTGKRWPVLYEVELVPAPGHDS